jgi:hypothetical protein
MKKNLKRLSVHRETLRNLQQPDLRRAAGGGTNTEYLENSGCACSETCNPDTYGCGTGTCNTGSFRCTYEDLTTCVC